VVRELVCLFFEDYLDYLASLLVWKKSSTKKTLTALEQFSRHLASAPAKVFTTSADVDMSMQKFVSESGYKTGEVYWPVRVALSGSDKSPGPQEIIWVIGKEASITKIKAAIAKLKQETR